MLTRRRLIQASAASWLLAGLPRARAQSAAVRAAPRSFVTIFLRGGMDAVYTTDPKVRADVDADIDVPYEPSAIVEAGGLRLGPHLRPLTPWAGRMAIVRGVQVQTANHESGAHQILRMRNAVTPSMPSLFDIIGAHRQGQPLATVSLGKLSSFEHSPGALAAPTGFAGSETSLDVVDKMNDEDVAILAAAYRKHAARFPTSRLSASEAATKEHVEQIAAFFGALQKVPRFKATDWGLKGDAGRAAEDLQRTLWFLEHDLTRSVFLKIQFDWDSHYRNADKQTRATGDFTQILDKFLAGLRDKGLADKTVVAIGSELGRYPVINGNLGKDHFPETQLIMMGPGLKTGAAFGRTGKRMEGLKTSLTTGQPDDVGGAPLILDDVGTTMLHMAGLQPAQFGYTGHRLSFLEQA